jgi:hypothetical protein
MAQNIFSGTRLIRTLSGGLGTSCSWLNLIERWFAELTNKRIRRDSFLSVDDLIAAMNELPCRMEQTSKALRLDRNGRFHRHQTHRLSPNARTNSARLHRAEITQT